MSIKTTEEKEYEEPTTLKLSNVFTSREEQ
jgi:hypothetical protein